MAKYSEMYRWYKTTTKISFKLDCKHIFSSKIPLLRIEFSTGFKKECLNSDHFEIYQIMAAILGFVIFWWQFVIKAAENLRKRLNEENLGWQDNVFLNICVKFGYATWFSASSVLPNSKNESKLFLGVESVILNFKKSLFYFLRLLEQLLVFSSNKYCRFYSLYCRQY